MNKHRYILASRSERAYFARYMLEIDERPWYVPKETRTYLLREANNVCNLCGRCVGDALLHIDHVHPVRLGGTCLYHNLQVLCSTCNLQKGMHILDPSSYYLHYVKPLSLVSERTIRNKILDKLEDERA